jgi:predicted RNA-binding Zn-ribbon protein involved in translation (DUF1610 family)
VAKQMNEDDASEIEHLKAAVAQAHEGIYDCTCGAVVQPVTAARPSLPCPACGGHALLRAALTPPPADGPP